MLLEKIFTIFVLFISTAAVIPLLRQESGFTLDLVEGDPLMQAIWFGIYGVTLILIVRIWKSATRIAIQDKFFILLVLIACFSICWSDAPLVSFRRCGALLGTTAFGVYLSARYSLREQLQMLGWALGISAVLSLAFVCFAPSLGVSSGIHEGAWRGVYAHKNVLGRLMLLSLIVYFILFRSIGTPLNRFLTGAALVLTGYLLVMSTSKTALVLFVSFMLLVPFYRALRLNYKLFSIYLLLVVAVTSGLMGWLLSNTEEVAIAMGRDVTLTGRTKLWEVVVEMIKERFWLGYGYNAFWLGLQGESRYVWLVTNFETIHAHNGYLDLLLDLGFFGFIVFAMGFFLNFLKALTLARLTTTMEELWPIVYLSLMLLYNITESSILVRNSLFWILYVSTIFSMNKIFYILGQSVECQKSPQ